MIKLENISKSYNNKNVFVNFSYCFSKGAVYVLSGPSGCGKTTLLRLIAGLEKPDNGDIYVQSKKTSMVFQEDRLISQISVVDNIKCVLPNNEWKNIDKYLKDVDLYESAHDLAQNLSGGMKRRLAVVRSVAYGGDIVLMDEPFKGLDIKLKTKVMDFVFAQSCRQNNTVLIITHEREEIDYMKNTGANILNLSGLPFEILFVN